ncbi:MAG TPA: antitoxin MazE-like protein [Rhizomicrobium sp.]|jgi:hypothetical protein
MMTRPPKREEFDKFRRYRESRKAQGLRLLRLWVSDPRTASFRRKAKRQAALLRGAPEEEEALSFIERNMDQGDWTA